MQSYDTVVEAINGLRSQGYTVDFNLAFDKIICSRNIHLLHPEDFDIEQAFRFEGDTNPSDEDVVYAISSKDGLIKGILTGAYGTYADSLSADMLQKLSKHS